MPHTHIAFIHILWCVRQSPAKSKKVARFAVISHRRSLPLISPRPHSNLHHSPRRSLAHVIRLHRLITLSVWSTAGKVTLT